MLWKCRLRPYPKGVSGNPGGKPRVDVSAIIARAILEGNQEAIYEGLAKALIKGNAYVFKELSERAYGKVNVTVASICRMMRSAYPQLLQGTRKLG